MFFMGGRYHSSTVSVRVATTAWRNMPGTTQGPWAMLPPLPIYPRLGWISACVAALRLRSQRATTGGAPCHSRSVPPTRWIWGRSQPWSEPKGFPSDFPPLDARSRGTGRNGRGRRVTTEAVDRLFMHVTAVVRDQAGMAGDFRGAGAATVKSPALPTQVRILSLPHYP